MFSSELDQDSQKVKKVGLLVPFQVLKQHGLTVVTITDTVFSKFFQPTKLYLVSYNDVTNPVVV